MLKPGNEMSAWWKLLLPCGRNSAASCLKITMSSVTAVDDCAAKSSVSRSAAADLKVILRAVSWRVETAPPVIAKIHKPGKATADPLHGRYDADCRRKEAVLSNMNPIPTCGTPNRCRCLKKGASRRSSVARCCPTRRTPGLTSQKQRSATKSASPAISTSRSRCARWRRFAPTSWPSRRKPKGCWMIY